jgi:Phospholipase C
MADVHRLLLLTAALVAVSMALISLTLIHARRAAAVTKAATQQHGTATPIGHVVIILENHAFDNIYGTYPFGIPPIIDNVTLSLARPFGLNLGATVGGVKPYYANSVLLTNPWEAI